MVWVCVCACVYFVWGGVLVEVTGGRGSLSCFPRTSLTSAELLRVRCVFWGRGRYGGDEGDVRVCVLEGGGACGSAEGGGRLSLLSTHLLDQSRAIAVREEMSYMRIGGEGKEVAVGEGERRGG